MVRKLQWMPLTHEQKQQTIATTILLKALYGSELGHCAQQQLRALQAAIADVIGPRSAKRSQAIVFELAQHRGDLDPYAHLLARKVTLLLRVLAKYPQSTTKANIMIIPNVQIPPPVPEHQPSA